MCQQPQVADVDLQERGCRIDFPFFRHLTDFYKLHQHSRNIVSHSSGMQKVLRSFEPIPEGSLSMV